MNSYTNEMWLYRRLYEVNTIKNIFVLHFILYYLSNSWLQ